MKKHRKLFISWLFRYSQKLYTNWFKQHDGWQTNGVKLLKYSKGSLGQELGLFLQKNGFQLIPKVERHDAYHVLTGYGTKVEDEIALQYLCYGNGKKSPYLLGAIILGTLILPDYLSYYLESYQKGCNANPFHHYNYEKLLHIPLVELRFVFFGWKNTYQQTESIITKS